MRPKLLMTASAVVLGLAGVAASFAPAELLTAWGSPATEQTVILVQLLGALYLSFALLNWTARGVMIGGIYARPVSLGNFLHFTMGALALVKQIGSRDLGLPLVAALVVYAVFAILFGLVVFGRARA
jgi:hypothetical protein